MDLTNFPIFVFINKFDLPPALVLLLMFIPILPNLWGILHAYRRFFPNMMVEKIAWIMVCVFFPVIGGVLYIFIGRKRSSIHPIEE